MSNEIIPAFRKPELRNAFMKKVLQDIDAMKLLLEKDLFERDKIRIGAEQELHLIDADYNPAPLAMKVMEEMNDTRLASEYALFNLEINAEPLDFSDTVFSELQENIRYKLDQISQVSSKYKAKVLLTGILPSLKRKHLELENLTPNPRFRIMLDIVNESRGRDYEFHIEGQDQLITRENPVVFGGALTSFQVHLQIDAHRAGEFYNWAQAIAGPVLAASANSPIFLNKRLWQETRIALFRQTADTRKPYHNPRAEKSRVFFGEKWVDGSILSQFREDILRYEPLVAVEVKENSLQAITENKIPRLEALNFFTGTIYRWNRTCYGITDGRPHLRIENRFIPSGPTLVDQIANAAFWIGLMLGMKGKYAEVKDHMEFDSARKNFYKAAKYGLDVHFDWLDGRNLTARQLILDELLPLSRKALEENGVHSKEIDHYLEIIEKRVESGQTGAAWMISNFNTIRKEKSADDASLALTASMHLRHLQGKPVHEWKPVKAEVTEMISSKQVAVRQVMSRNIYTVLSGDLLEMAARIMKWKQWAHIPVEDNDGKFIGMISRESIFNELMGSKAGFDDKTVGDLMVKNIPGLDPDDPIEKAGEIMVNQKLSGLPVVVRGSITGMVTLSDMLSFSMDYLKQRKKTES